MRQPAPHVRILLAIADVGRSVDYLEEAGIAEPVTIRHARNRKPVRSERPCITIIMTGDEPRPDEMQRNDWETTREMTFDLQADMELPTEVSDEDPTGLGDISLFLAAMVYAIRAPGNPLLQLVDWVMPGKLDPNDDSPSDDGRMTRGLSVVYRVRSDDENELLAAGEQS